MLTVIVPTYNAELYLSQAIGSLLSENNIELEILAINDGSTDGSLAIMQDFASRDSRIRVIDKPNEGYGATCNLGIREAKGDWVAILEPDDWIEPGMYSDMLRKRSNFIAPIEGEFTLRISRSPFMMRRTFLRTIRQYGRPSIGVIF